jgi:hypothetical protein
VEEMFDPKREDVTSSWRTVHNAWFYSSSPTPYIIMVAGLLERTWEDTVNMDFKGRVKSIAIPVTGHGA